MDNKGGGAATGETKVKRMHTFALANTSQVSVISMHVSNGIICIFNIYINHF